MKLGWGETFRTQYISANRQYPDCLWYIWKHEANTHEPVTHATLSGYLTGFDVKEGEHKGKPTYKLRTYLKANGRSYCVVSGLETGFSAGLMSALNELGGAFLRDNWIAIEPTAGDDEKVLFCNVYTAKGHCFAPPSEGLDIRGVMQQLNAALGDQQEERKKEIASQHSQPSAVPKPLPKINASGKSAQQVAQELKLPIGVEQGFADPTPPAVSADSLNKEIDFMALDQVEAIGAKIESAKEILGPTFASVMDRFSRKVMTLSNEAQKADNQLQLIESIGARINQLNWTKKRASDSLFERYGKRTRAELTGGELVDFDAFLSAVQESKIEEVGGQSNGLESW